MFHRGKFATYSCLEAFLFFEVMRPQFADLDLRFIIVFEFARALTISLTKSKAPVS